MVGDKGAMDLYHMYSHPNWLILDTGEIITGTHAALIKPCKPDFTTRSSNTQWAETTINGELRKVYGVVYFK